MLFIKTKVSRGYIIILGRKCKSSIVLALTFPLSPPSSPNFGRACPRQGREGQGVGEGCHRHLSKPSFANRITLKPAAVRSMVGTRGFAGAHVRFASVAYSQMGE